MFYLNFSSRFHPFSFENLFRGDKWSPLRWLMFKTVHNKQNKCNINMKTFCKLASSKHSFNFTIFCTLCNVPGLRLWHVFVILSSRCCVPASIYCLHYLLVLYILYILYNCRAIHLANLISRQLQPILSTEWPNNRNRLSEVFNGQVTTDSLFVPSSIDKHNFYNCNIYFYLKS